MSINFIIAGSVAVAYLGYRFFLDMRTKAGTSNLAKQLQNDPAVAEGFAETLDITVQRSSSIKSNFNQAFEPLLTKTTTKIGNFQIYHIQKLADGSYLLVTTTDYVESIDRRGDTSEVYNLNFVCKIDADKNQYVVVSDMHTSLIDKNLRSDFAKSLFELLNKSVPA